MNYPWIWGVHGSWIQSPQSQCVHSLCVSDLIADEERVWDIDKIESLFSEDLVQAILDTPLFAEVHNDIIAWMIERNMIVLEREAVALLDAIHFADVNTWDQAIFESDSATLVQTLSSSGHGDSKFYAIVSSIIYQFSFHSNFKVKFVKRQVNMVAHTLTRAACSWVSPYFLFLSFMYWTLVD